MGGGGGGKPPKAPLRSCVKICASHL